jgi:hypothetical protein
MTVAAIVTVLTFLFFFLYRTLLIVGYFWLKQEIFAAAEGL